MRRCEGQQLSVEKKVPRRWAGGESSGSARFLLTQDMEKELVPAATPKRKAAGGSQGHTGERPQPKAGHGSLGRNMRSQQGS